MLTHEQLLETSLTQAAPPPEQPSAPIWRPVAPPPPPSDEEDEAGIQRRRWAVRESCGSRRALGV